MNEISEESYRRLKREVEEARAESERAQGALDQLIQQLRSEFECNSLKEAKTMLLKIQDQRDKAGESFSAAMSDYQSKWKQDDPHL